MIDRYMKELTRVSLGAIIVGVIVWLFGDFYWTAGYGSTSVWYVFLYGGVFLIAIGVAEWTYLSRKVRLI